MFDVDGSMIAVIAHTGLGTQTLRAQSFVQSCFFVVLVLVSRVPWVLPFMCPLLAHLPICRINRILDEEQHGVVGVIQAPGRNDSVDAPRDVPAPHTLGVAHERRFGPLRLCRRHSGND